MSSIGIISDLHGSAALLHGILRTIGATDAAGKRQPGWHLTAVGDVVGRSMVPRHIKLPPEAFDELGLIKRDLLVRMTLVEQARDFETLEEAELLLDGIVIGNHEGADWGCVDFRGYDKADSPVKQRVRDLTRSGFIHAAEAHGDWLVTHAGLSADFFEELGDLAPASLAERLNRDLEEVVNTPGGHLESFRPYDEFKAPRYLTAIGPERWDGPFRMPTTGGILWCGWKELAASYDEWAEQHEAPPTLQQIVGHTPHQAGPVRNEKYPLVDIDAGACEWWKVGAAVSHDGGKTWETHTYHNQLKV